VVARDYFEQEIKVGDLLVYPGRQGSSLWMSHLTVTAVVIQEDEWSSRGPYAVVKGIKESGKKVSITELGRTVVVQRQLTEQGES